MPISKTSNAVTPQKSDTNPALSNRPQDPTNGNLKGRKIKSMNTSSPWDFPRVFAMGKKIFTYYLLFSAAFIPQAGVKIHDSQIQTPQPFVPMISYPNCTIYDRPIVPYLNPTDLTYPNEHLSEQISVINPESLIHLPESLIPLTPKTDIQEKDANITKTLPLKEENITNASSVVSNNLSIPQLTTENPKANIDAMTSLTTSIFTGLSSNTLRITSCAITLLTAFYNPKSLLHLGIEWEDPYPHLRPFWSNAGIKYSGYKNIDIVHNREIITSIIKILQLDQYMNI